MANNTGSLIASPKKGKSNKSKGGVKINITPPKDFNPATTTAEANPYERKPIGLFKPLDYLNRGQYMVLNPLRRLTDTTKSYSPGEYIKSSVAGLLGKERSETADVLENFGWKPTTLKGKIARGAVGLAGDILFDPMTYLPGGQLTKAGKAAKAGALVKIGKHAFDLRNDLPKAISFISKELAAKGEKAEDIAKFTKELGGIASETLAKDLVNKLSTKKIAAEAVELAPNWAKQFKRGQRALLQFELPRIFGGASARIPVIGDKAEGKLFRNLSRANIRLQAARTLTNKNVYDKLSSGAQTAIRHQAKDFWPALGKTANAVADTLNFIATPLKKATRYARGYSNQEVEKTIQQINDVLGGNSEKLYKGAKDFEDSLGGMIRKFDKADDIAARLELIGGLRHPAVQEDLARKLGKGTLDFGDWEKLSIDDIIDSLDTINSKSERSLWAPANNALRASLKTDYVPDLFLSSGERVGRMKNTAKRWGDIRAIRDVTEANNILERQAQNLGGVTSKQIESQIMGNGSGYIPFVLADEFSSFYDPKFSHHGQTIFEARHGVRDPEVVKHLIENKDKIFKKSDSGEIITGFDILTGKKGNAVKTFGPARILNDDFPLEMLEGSESRLFNTVGNTNWNEYKKLADVASNPSSTIEDVNKAYADFVGAVGDDLLKNKDLYKTNKQEFSTDIFKALVMKADSLQQVAQKRLAVEGIVKYAKALGKDEKKAPLGYVMLKDAIPPENLERIAKRWEHGDEFLKSIEGKAIPYNWVKPITEMTSIDRETTGAFARTYDWALSILRPFMLSAPATQVRNFISSLFMGFAAGDYSNMAKRGNFWRSVMYHGSRYKVGGDSMIDIRGKLYRLSDMWNDYKVYGGKSMSQVTREFAVPPPKGKASKILRGAKKTSDFMTYPTSKAAEIVEDSVRFNHYLNMLQSGASPQEAIESVALHFYDYADLSKAEQGVLRRVFPFYTFFRKNMEANLRYVLTNMGYASTPAKMARNVTRMSEGEEGTFPLEWLDQDRQKWLTDQGVFRLPWNKRLMTMQGFLPQADVASVLSPLKTGANQLMNMLTPVAKIPYEIANNKDTFTGKEIQNPLKPTTYFLGADINPKLVHSLRPFRILDTIDKAVKNMGPGRAAAHGYNNPNGAGDTLGQRAKNAVADATAFRTYYEEPEDVRLNKVMESSKWIRRIDQYLKSHPDIAPMMKQRILRERENLAAEVEKAGGK